MTGAGSLVFALVLALGAPRLDAEARRHADRARRYLAEHPAMQTALRDEARRARVDEALLTATIEEESEWRAGAENKTSNAIGLGQHLLRNEPECRGPAGLRDEDCAKARDRLLNGPYNLHRTAVAFAHLNGDKTCRTKTTANKLLCVLARYGGLTLDQAKRSSRVQLILAIRRHLLNPGRKPSNLKQTKRVRRPVGHGATTGRSRRGR